MASLVGAMGTLENFGVLDVILPFILIFAIIFGILEKLKLISEKPAINVTISLVVAFLFTSFIKAGRFVRLLTPMLVGMIIVLLFMFLIFRFTGVHQDAISGVFKKYVIVTGIVIGVIVLFVFSAMNTAFPELAAPNLKPRDTINGTASNATSDKAIQDIFMQQVQEIFNPTVVAMIIMLLVFAIAAFMIVRK